jgi:hypothetical protein
MTPPMQITVLLIRTAKKTVVKHQNGHVLISLFIISIRCMIIIVEWIDASR